MSFSIQSGKVWDTNEAITAQKLNDMLDEATAFGLISSDFATGYRLFDVATIEPTPTLGYPWVDTDGFIRLGDGTRFSYDSGVVFLKNNMGVTARKGTAVQIDPTATDSFYYGAVGGNRNRAVGVVLSHTPPAAFGAIMYKGIAQVNIVSALESGSSIFGLDRLGFSVCLETTMGETGDCLMAHTFGPSGGNALSDGHMMFFGTTIEFAGAVNPFSPITPTLYWCKIHK